MVYHKSDMECSGIEPEPAHWKLVIEKLCSDVYFWPNVEPCGQLVTQNDCAV